MRRMIEAAALVVLMMPLSANASQHGQTVQNLLAACEGSDAGRMYCLGMVSGVAFVLGPINSNSESQGKIRACYPDGVTPGQFRQVFVNWAKAHPQHWQLRSSLGVVVAIKETWPCPK